MGTGDAHQVRPSLVLAPEDATLTVRTEGLGAMVIGAAALIVRDGIATGLPGGSPTAGAGHGGDYFLVSAVHLRYCSCGWTVISSSESMS